MKTNYFQGIAAVAAAGMMLSSPSVYAQDSTANTTQPAAAPMLPYGVAQIIQLEQAKVGDDTIIAYIKNSGNSYGLNADIIIYLKQQGVSGPVINAMLSQPKPGVLSASSTSPTVTVPSTPAPNVSQPQSATYSQPVSTSIVGPSVTAIDPSAAAAASYTYYQPYYYSYPYYSYPGYYYPDYGYYYPSVSVSLGWGGRWGGGWHGGGGFHGGGFHGGGGWHR